MSKKNKKEISLPDQQEIEAELARCKSKKRFRKSLRSTIAVLITIAAAAILLSTWLFPVYRIYGNSMQPSLAQGDIVLSYKKSEIEQSDIIAFYYNNKILIKRVIAGPGDTVDIDGQGNVYVNGELLEEEYLAKKDFGNSDQTYPLQVADNSWFVLGDERSTSMDSRMSAIGTISEEQIIGKIVLRIWPLGAVGTVK